MGPTNTQSKFKRKKKEESDHMSKTLSCKKNYSHPIGYSKFWRFFSLQIIETQLFCNKNFFLIKIYIKIHNFLWSTNRV